MKQANSNSFDLSVNRLREHFLQRDVTNSSNCKQMPSRENSSLYKDDSNFFKALCDETNQSAAVLIPIHYLPNGPELLLTRRADHLRSHAGQISFPGGRLEQEDRSFAEAALREAQEEISLPVDKVDVLGYLDDYFTISGFRVTPVVGLIEEPVALIADPSEVAEIIHVPLEQLLKPDVFQLVEHPYGEVKRCYYSTHYRQYHIWGVTAGILMGLYEDLVAGNI